MCRKNNRDDPIEAAVIMNGDGKCIRLSDPGFIVVFRKNGCIWEAERSMSFSLDGAGSLTDLRLKVRDLLSFLGNCRIFAAESASGALFFELEKAGVSVYEISGKPDEFLDHILEDEELESESNSIQRDIPVPLVITPGNYTISIKDIQVATPHMSSKQILQGFIREGNFSSLEIFCDHLPPWIEINAEQKGMTLEIEQSGSRCLRVLLMNSVQLHR